MPKALILSFLLLFCLPAPLSGQECLPRPITSKAKNYNIFSPEQEMILGDLTNEQAAGDWRFVSDARLAEYLNQIGDRLIKHLPPTGLKFRFFIIDIPEANAFNVPGGYVYITRKLIAMTNNEDELAGVMAHELGHAVARHAASDFSRLFKKILNVTQVGDRRDIAEKYNLLIERARTKNVSADDDPAQEYEADRIGVFAMAAAGYDPSAALSFTERLEETKVKGGNWLSGLFGNSSHEEKLLREILKTTEQLPAQCRENRHPTASEVFLKWQADVISYRDQSRNENFPGLLWKKELSPKLRSDVSRFTFSPDGQFFLAQDDFAVTVLQREPLQVMFQIPATEVEEASFTPDSHHVVFGTTNLRFEKWSIDLKKPVEIRELSVRDDCWEHKFSPDGRFLACIDYTLGLNVVDTHSGKKVWEKKEFYLLSVWELLVWRWSQARNEGRGKPDSFFHLEFSPDGHFLVASRSSAFRYQMDFDDKTEDTMLTLDLNTLKTLGTGGELKKATRRPFLFLDGNRILAMGTGKVEDGGIFSFPEGKRLAKFFLTARELKRTQNSNYVIVKPLGTSRMGIFDLTKGEAVSGMKTMDAALWNNLIAYESVAGSALLAEISYNETEKKLEPKNVKSIDIPVASLGRPLAADISDNFEWLAVSSETRGALWSLASGERKMYVRGFGGALVADSGATVGDFSKFEETNHSLVVMRPSTQTVESLREIPEAGAKQYRRFLLLRKSLKPDSTKKESNKNSGMLSVASPSLNREVKFELIDVILDKSVWSAEFPKEAPQFFIDEFSERLVLFWALGSDAGKARLKENPVLAAQAREMGNKDDDYLVEIVDAFAGKVVGSLLLETGNGSFDIDGGFSEGDWLVLRDSENRLLAYSIKERKLHHRFFGSHGTINPVKNQLAIENYPGELGLYNLSNGESQSRLRFPGSASFIRFSLNGSKLFVLDGQQTAYVFDVEKLVAKPMPPQPALP